MFSDTVSSHGRQAKLVEITGLKPATYTMPSYRSINWAISPWTEGKCPSVWFASPLGDGVPSYFIVCRLPQLSENASQHFQIPFHHMGDRLNWCSVWDFNPRFLIRSISSDSNAHVTICHFHSENMFAFPLNQPNTKLLGSPLDGPVTPSTLKLGRWDDWWDLKAISHPRVG